MSAEPQKYLLSVDDYYRMAKAGLFSKGPHVELIEGEVIEMNPNCQPPCWMCGRISRRFLFLKLRDSQSSVCGGRSASMSIQSLSLTSPCSSHAAIIIAARIRHRLKYYWLSKSPTSTVAGLSLKVDEILG
jgi:hypothetical protein